MEHMYNQMLSQGIKPNVVIFTSMISAYGNKGDMDAVKRILQTMAELSIQPNEVN
jgi:pentatricopeptide repeat protein